MGRGDKKTKKGKMTIGSFGVIRPARAPKKLTTAAPAAEKESASAKVVAKAPKA